MFDIKKILKMGIQGIVGSYRLNWIYACDVYQDGENTCRFLVTRITDLSDITNALDRRIRYSGSFAGDGALGYGIWNEGRLVSTCWVWLLDRPSWDLVWSPGPEEAVLVDVATGNANQRMGYASALLASVAHKLYSENVKRVYAWVWWNHTASMKAFEKAGWKRIAFVAESYPPWFPHKLRLALKNPLKYGV